jgi:hypothetical protein
MVTSGRMESGFETVRFVASMLTSQFNSLQLTEKKTDHAYSIKVLNIWNAQMTNPMYSSLSD